MHIGLANADPNHAIAITARIAGMSAGSMSGLIVTAPAINSFNTFEQPSTVKAVAFDGARFEGGVLKVVLPAKSVVMLNAQ
jgi:alpha-N-arabinofuranosidase